MCHIYTKYMEKIEFIKRGVLNFHSETGTEGGYWTLQDENFITYEQSDWGLFAHHKVADPADIARRGIVKVSRYKDGTVANSLKPGVVVDLEIEWADGTTDIRSSDNILSERWSYDGLIFLNNQDNLTVYDKIDPAKVVWQGLVKLVDHDEAKVGPTLRHPFRLHHDQMGVDQNQWANWFFKEYPARLCRPGGFISR